MYFVNVKTVIFIRVLVILCITYNACLAFINAHFFSVSRPVVILSEILLLGSLLYLVYQTNFKKKDLWPIGLLVSAIFTVIIAYITTGGSIYVDSLRNVLILSVFVMVGTRMTERELHLLFIIISLCVFVFLLIEILSLPTYANIFRPGDYYANTRGIGTREYNDTGLFHAALGFSGRFSFGFFSGPRTSSIFLEQVSLGNFSSLLAIYIATFWSKLGKIRIFYIGLIFLVILSSNSRFGGFSVLIFWFGYFVFHKFPKYSNFLILPILLFLGVMLLNWVPDSGGDDLVGRTHKGFRLLYSSDFTDLLGFGVTRLHDFGDSGLAYLFFSNTIFTALPLIIFIKMYIPQNTITSRRFVFYLNLYIFLNLTISGNSIFSIKTAALLWLMTGVVLKSRYSEKKRELKQTCNT